MSTNQFESYKRYLKTKSIIFIFKLPEECYISTFNRHLYIQYYLNILINYNGENILKI